MFLRLRYPVAVVSLAALAVAPLCAAYSYMLPPPPLPASCAQSATPAKPSSYGPRLGVTTVPGRILQPIVINPAPKLPEESDGCNANHTAARPLAQGGGVFGGNQPRKKK